MIESLKIRNFRCLREVDVSLRPLTVLIGPNNTGKSAFLSAIELLGAGFEKKNSLGRIQSKDRWGHNIEVWPSISAMVGDETIEVFVNGDPLFPSSSNNHAQPFVWSWSGPLEQIAPVRLYGANGLVPKMQCQAAIEQEGVPLIDDQVSNVPAVLDAMLRKSRKRFDKSLAVLKNLIPGLEDILIESPDQKNRRIDLELEDGLVIPASDTSYGVRLTIFFVTLTNHPNPPRTILLEEPENGVHPNRLGDIASLLRGLTRGENVDHPTQVIITTHSPYLLDSIDVETDQVLVAQRVSDGRRTITPIDPERLEGFLDEFMLGEVWSAQGEVGLIGKDSNR